MGAKYERAYSYPDCVILRISQFEPAALPRRRLRTRFVTSGRKRTVRKADANKEARYNRKINNNSMYFGYFNVDRRCYKTFVGESYGSATRL